MVVGEPPVVTVFLLVKEGREAWKGEDCCADEHQ
jgi:hypothetical protein